MAGGPSARAVAAALQCSGGDVNSGVSGAGSAEGAAAGGGFKEVSRLFPGSCHISGWGKTCRGGRHRGGCQEEPWGLHSRVGGCPGLGGGVGGESRLREQKPAAVRGGGQGWGGQPELGFGHAGGSGQPPLSRAGAVGVLLSRRLHPPPCVSIMGDLGPAPVQPCCAPPKSPTGGKRSGSSSSPG